MVDAQLLQVGEFDTIKGLPLAIRAANLTITTVGALLLPDTTRPAAVRWTAFRGLENLANVITTR